MHYQVKLILNFLDTSISKLDTNIHLPRNKDKNVHKYEVREKKDIFLWKKDQQIDIFEKLSLINQY